MERQAQLASITTQDTKSFHCQWPNALGLCSSRAALILGFHHIFHTELFTCRIVDPVG